MSDRQSGKSVCWLFSLGLGLGWVAVGRQVAAVGLGLRILHDRVRTVQSLRG